MSSEKRPQYANLVESTFLNFVDHHVELPSTNDHANEIATVEDLQTPALIICDQQIAGRGRGSNRWWSTSDNLAFSIIVDLPTSITPERSLLMSPAISLAICEAIAAFHAADPFQIKWPNDVYVCGRKIAGILIESSKLPRRWITGCGINVNHPTAAAMKSEDSSDLLKQAISLIDLTGRSSDRVELLQRIIDSFEQKLKLVETDQAKLIDQVRSCCFLTGKEVTIAQAEKKISGECLGIDHRGGMQIRTAAKIETVFSGIVESISDI